MGLPAIRAQADHILENNSTPEKFWELAVTIISEYQPLIESETQIKHRD